MKPNNSKNPSRLIVEGPDDQHTIVHLTRARGVDWDSDGSSAPYIQSAGGIDSALQQISASLKVVRRLGIVLDADDSASSRWEDVRRALGVTSAPEELPREGYLGIAENGCRVGVWLIPDNRRSGSLEDVVIDLIPSADPVWAYAQEVSAEARLRGARFAARHLPKASVRTWLAWQEQPGVPPGEAIKRTYLDAHAPVASGFVGWFKRMFLE